jgi:trehalose/maltose hydrolase-like predicted phosphorylase
MVRGNPKEFYIQAAKESVQRSANEEAAQRKKDIEQAAKRMLEEQQRAKLEKDVADATKALENQIAELKRAAAAELAKLN